jgi:hypothetical protein
VLDGRRRTYNAIIDVSTVDRASKAAAGELPGHDGGRKPAAEGKQAKKELKMRKRDGD